MRQSAEEPLTSLVAMLLPFPGTLTARLFEVRRLALALESPALAHIASPIAGEADILLVPDLEAGKMLAKELSFLADAAAAGIVLGARVPIILASRAENVCARMVSCAVAVLHSPFSMSMRTASPPSGSASFPGEA